MAKMGRPIKDPDFYPCGDVRDERNTIVRKDGVKVCRSCHYAATNRYQKSSADKVKATQRKWIEENREKFNEIQRSYYHRNKERIAAQRKEREARKKSGNESRDS